MKLRDTHWEFEEEFNPEDYYGFVYLIENTVSGRKYIGRKNFFTRQRKKVANRKNRKVVVKESDWKKYMSSCAELKSDIKSLGEDIFTFTILSLHLSKQDLNYSEAEEQINRDVLTKRLPDGTRLYYNNNIMSKFFARESWEDLRKRRWINKEHEELFVTEEEYNQKLEEGWEPGRKKHDRYFYARQRGKRNTIHKAIANGNHPTLGKGHTDESKKKMSEAAKTHYASLSDHEKKLLKRRARTRMTSTKNHKFKPWMYKEPGKDWVEVHDKTIKDFCLDQGKYKVRIATWSKPKRKTSQWYGWDFKYLEE